MERPSLIIWRMAGTPSAVPGIFTSRFGLAMVSCSRRAAAAVPSVSWAKPGSTSTLTKPSPPSEESWSGAKTSSALRMSWSTSAQ